MKKRKKITCLALIVVILGIAAPVSAATTHQMTASVSIVGGALGISSSASTIGFGTVTMNGLTQEKKTAFAPLEVEDLTGLGAGWSVTVQAGRFTSGTEQLPAGSLVLESVGSIAALNGTTSAVPTVVGTAPYTLDGGSAVKVVSAAVGTGMGKYQMNFNAESLKLTVNTANTVVKAQPYESVVTWTIVAGP